MGEGITTGFISAKSGSSTVTVFIRGPISPKCLELLKLLLKRWAKRCGLKIDSVKVKLKKLKKKPKKK